MNGHSFRVKLEAMIVLAEILTLQLLREHSLTWKIRLVSSFVFSRENCELI